MSAATLDIVFDGPPGPESGRFVEVEIDGRGVRAGEWSQRKDGLWVLRIPRADVRLPSTEDDRG